MTDYEFIRAVERFELYFRIIAVLAVLGFVLGVVNLVAVLA